jgi:hypothetical protein
LKSPSWSLHLEKSSKEKKKKKPISSKYEFGNSPFSNLQEGIEIPSYDSNSSMQLKSRSHYLTSSKQRWGDYSSDLDS